MNTASPREKRKKYPEHLADNENPNQHSTGPGEQPQRGYPIGDPRQNGSTNSERAKSGSSASVAGSQNARLVRRSEAMPAAVSKRGPRILTSSASDGSIATRTGAAVVPATSNDARLSHSAVPATVAALIGDQD